MSDKKLTQAYLQSIERLELAPGHRFAIAELVHVWRQETDCIKRFDRETLPRSARQDTSK